MDWRSISSKELSEEFIREFSDKVYWPNICKYQKLSEEFIREFQDKYWNELCWYMGLSRQRRKQSILVVVKSYQKNFIRDFQDKLDWNNMYIC
jgi:hypothetical protein